MDIWDSVIALDYPTKLDHSKGMIDMATALVLTGKQGPAFGDRASFTSIEVLDEPQGCTWVNRITNWPASERADALRAAFAPFVEEV